MKTQLQATQLCLLGHCVIQIVDILIFMKLARNLETVNKS